MNARRALIACVAAQIATSALSVRAQTDAPRMRRIGLLAFDPPSPASEVLRGAIVAGLLDLGFTEGRDYTILRIDAGGQAERLPTAAAELVAARVDVILTYTTQMTLAAKNATLAIPIVMLFVSDPVRSGLVSSLAHPGNNLTGIANLDSELIGKRLELLRAMVPALSRLAVLGNPDHPVYTIDRAEVDSVARRLKLQVVPVDVRRRLDLADALGHIERARPDGCIVTSGVLTAVGPGVFDSLARLRIPNVANGTNARQGALLSYGSDIAGEFRQAAGFVAKIFRGAKPADLPVEQVTRLDLIVNARAAAVIGVTIPQSLLLRADEVIQ